MERVVKRYLMHNQGEVDDLKQSECEEIKQDMQLMRYEIKNDMKKSREDTIRNMLIINNGMQFIAEELIEQCNSDIWRHSSLSGDGDRMSLDSQQGKSSKFKDLVLKNKNFLKSITVLNNLDMSRDDEKEPDTSNTSTATGVSGGAGGGGVSCGGVGGGKGDVVVDDCREGDGGGDEEIQVKEKNKNEEFNLERLAFDINTVYEDD
jgi:hypothetical protein